MLPPLSISIAIPRQDSAGAMEACLSLESEDLEQRIQFRFTGEGLAAPLLGPEAATALALVPAMRLDRGLRVEGACFPGWDGQVDQFQEIFSCWYPEHRRVEVRWEGGRRDAGEAVPAPGVGVFFSGGVDSLYSLLKHREEITHGIFVHGCDIPLDRGTHRELVSGRLREACADFGISLIEVETDLLEFTDPLAHWGYHYHGSALSGIGMLLSRVIGKVYIGSTAMWRDLVPWGSHPCTDPLWSTPLLAVRHDGCECRRAEKIHRIASDDTALRHLRVCWENEEGSYNCGRCEKCLRTMTGLRLAGALDRCEAFAVPLDLQRLLATVTFARGGHHWRDMLARAEAAGQDQELVAALREVCRINGHAEQVKAFARDNRGILSSPDWQRLLPKVRNKIFRTLAEHDEGWFRDALAAAAPQAREEIFDRLWGHDRRWLRARLRRAEREHLKRRLLGWMGRRGRGSPSQS